MNIEEHLMISTSRKIWDEVVEYVGEDEERFAGLIHLFLNGPTRTVQLSSQPVGYIAEKNPRLIRPYLPEIVGYLKSNPIDAVKRNTMRMFQFIEIPEELEGDLFEIGMQYIRSAQEAVAIRAFSMTVLRRICEKYPELAQEVLCQIEILVKENVSKGLTSRGRHELKKLSAIIENS